MSIHEEYSVKLNAILDTFNARYAKADGDGALIMAAMNSAVDAAEAERNAANDKILASGSDLLLKRKTYEEMVEQREREDIEGIVPGTGSENSPDVPENCTQGRHLEYVNLPQPVLLKDKRGAWDTWWKVNGYIDHAKRHEFH